MLEYIAISYVVFAAIATFVIVRSKHLERVQTISQAAVVWLIPFVGAFIILVFHWTVHTNMTTKAKPDSPSNNSDEVPAYDLWQELDR